MKLYDEEVITLIQLFLCGGLSSQQEAKLQQWIGQNPEHRKIFEEICNDTSLFRQNTLYHQIDREKAWQNIRRGKSKRNTHLSISRNKLYSRVAAVILPFLVIAGGYWIFSLHQSKQTPVVVATTSIQPGTAKATLRLADNKIVPLDAHFNETVQVTPNLNAQNTPTGIVYPEQKAEEKAEENILQVSRGGEYSVTLSDGTIVLLNSGSELRYPVAFTASQREVYISGEGYFEVAKDTARPFLVHTDHLCITVYGTSFNINTHDRENIQTVLVEGKIGIRTSGDPEEYQIYPGHLASFDPIHATMDIRQVDVYPYVAWKDQVFVFEDKSLEDIMNTLSLWYDTEIFFQNSALRNLHFTGNLGRYESINTILNAISEVTPVKFSVQGRTIVVKE